jgi:hypothetical protein
MHVNFQPSPRTSNWNRVWGNRFRNTSSDVAIEPDCGDAVGGDVYHNP